MSGEQHQQYGATTSDGHGGFVATSGNEKVVMELSASSQRQREEHEAMLAQLAIKKVAASASIQVPTLPDQVRAALRQMGLPVRLFGENLANVRDRLKVELAKRHGLPLPDEIAQLEGAPKVEEEEVTKYTRASHALIKARQDFALFSLERAHRRLDRERQLRTLAKRKLAKNRISLTLDDEEKHVEKPEDESELWILDEICVNKYKAFRRLALEGSQYGDSRALSSICSKNVDGTPLIATGSWTGNIQLWDGSSPALLSLGQKTMCHEDRIMGLAMISTPGCDAGIVASASIDMTAKLWKVTRQPDEESRIFKIDEVQHLKGHEARLCRAAFHPLKTHLATTSFDHTWRLWDVETGGNLLLQDGHVRECYGVGFHPDGGLVATSDFAGVIHLWDLRTGKSIKHFMGHAKRVLNTEFHPNCFQLASSGDDGTVKIWDLRNRKQFASVPAHSNLITCMRFDASGECLLTCSFDGSTKIWATRNMKMLNMMQAHEGKVSGVDFQQDRCEVVSAGFDKTLKLWK